MFVNTITTVLSFCKIKSNLKNLPGPSAVSPDESLHLVLVFFCSTTAAPHRSALGQEGPVPVQDRHTHALVAEGVELELRAGPGALPGGVELGADPLGAVEHPGQGHAIPGASETRVTVAREVMRLF